MKKPAKKSSRSRRTFEEAAGRGSPVGTFTRGVPPSERTMGPHEPKRGSAMEAATQLADHERRITALELHVEALAARIKMLEARREWGAVGGVMRGASGNPDVPSPDVIAMIAATFLAQKKKMPGAPDREEINAAVRLWLVARLECKQVAEHLARQQQQGT